MPFKEISNPDMYLEEMSFRYYDIVLKPPTLTLAKYSIQQGRLPSDRELFIYPKPIDTVAYGLSGIDSTLGCRIDTTGPFGSEKINPSVDSFIHKKFLISEYEALVSYTPDQSEFACISLSYVRDVERYSDPLELARVAVEIRFRSETVLQRIIIQDILISERGEMGNATWFPVDHDGSSGIKIVDFTPQNITLHKATGWPARFVKPEHIVKFNKATAIAMIPEFLEGGRIAQATSTTDVPFILGDLLY